MNFVHRLQNPNGLITTGNTMNLLDESNPNFMQLRLAQMMTTFASMNSANMGQNRNDHNNNDADSMMNTFANLQRNFLIQYLNDPIAAAQAAQAAAAAAATVSASQIKPNLSPISLITSNTKQSGSCRKRKSTPEKRVLTNHRSSNNNNNNGNVRSLISY